MSRARDRSTLATRGRRVRPVRLAPIATVVRFEADGSVYLRAPAPLGSYPTSITEPLEHWADHAPDRIFLAQRDPAGAWRAVTYRQAQSLLDRGLSSDRPVAILSGNSIEHGLLALACMYAGVLYSPVAPAYSLQ